MGDLPRICSTVTLLTPLVARSWASVRSNAPLSLAVPEQLTVLPL